MTASGAPASAPAAAQAGASGGLGGALQNAGSSFMDFARGYLGTVGPETDLGAWGEGGRALSSMQQMSRMNPTPPPPEIPSITPDPYPDALTIMQAFGLQG